jgi:8-oxo-dGTP diphosphatase
MSPAENTVRAAGGVVWRKPGPEVEVLLVHRPRYDDWSLPKGKAQPDESDEECALREVEEETGLRCQRGPEVGTTSYPDARGRQKVVRYFALRAPKQPARPQNEVDDLRWATLADAGELLTWERDRLLVRRVAPSLTAAGSGRR